MSGLTFEVTIWILVACRHLPGIELGTGGLRSCLPADMLTSWGGTCNCQRGFRLVTSLYMIIDILYNHVTELLRVESRGSVVLRDITS